LAFTAKKIKYPMRVCSYFTFTLNIEFNRKGEEGAKGFMDKFTPYRKSVSFAGFQQYL
jgi:hypothetical protein